MRSARIALRCGTGRNLWPLWPSAADHSSRPGWRRAACCSGPTAPGARPRSVVGAYIALTKPRIIELLLITTVPTMVLAERRLAAARPGAVDARRRDARRRRRQRHQHVRRPRHRRADAADPAPPARHRRHRAAPRPRRSRWSSRWPRSPCCGGAPTCSRPLLALGAAAFYVGVYTLWLKRTSRHNIVIGGAAGAVPVLVGWAAVTGLAGVGADRAVRRHVLLDAAALLGAGDPLRRRLPRRRRADAAGRRAGRRGRPPDDRLHGRAASSSTLRARAGRRPRLDLRRRRRACSAPASSLATVALARIPTPAASMRVFTYSITYVTVLFLALTVDVLVRL